METNTSLSLGRIDLPRCDESERALLGSLILYPEAWSSLNGFHQDAFYSAAHRTIFGVMARMRAEGDEVSMPVLVSELGNSGELERVGGAAYVAGLTDNALSQPGGFLKQIEETASRRAEITDAYGALQKAVKGEVKRRPVQIPGVLASKVSPETVQWLEGSGLGRIPLGKVTVFEGDPDELKSTVTIDLVARLTSGRPMPGCTDAIEPAGAVIVSLEDGVADTIVPRLGAAGADPNPCRASVASDRRASRSRSDSASRGPFPAPC